MVSASRAKVNRALTATPSTHGFNPSNANMIPANIFRLNQNIAP